MSNYNHKYLNEERTQELIDDIKEKMSSGGHVIQNASGTEMASRHGLQFEGRVDVTDDESNDKTIVNVADIYDDEVIALHETSNTAEHAYSKGDLLILNNKLYEAAVDINIGDELSSDSRFVDKTWNGLPDYFGGSKVWTDGDNIYYSDGENPNNYINLVLDKTTDTWSNKSWNGFTRLFGYDIWTDGENIYYSDNQKHYILDKSTSTWITKTWNLPNLFYGSDVWTDGENVYVSKGSTHYYLDKSTGTWVSKTWQGLTIFQGRYVWTDGENIYHSYNTTQYILDKSTNTWSVKSWNGLTDFDANYIWTDGEDIYYSFFSNKQFILDKTTSTWTTKTWNLSSILGSSIWTDRNNIYYSLSNTQKVLLKKNISESENIVELIKNLSNRIQNIENRYVASVEP